VLLLILLLLLPAAGAQMTSFKRYILSEALVCSWLVLLGSVQTIAPLQPFTAFALHVLRKLSPPPSCFGFQNGLSTQLLQISENIACCCL
jgi:hypothetical protein